MMLRYGEVDFCSLSLEVLCFGSKKIQEGLGTSGNADGGAIILSFYLITVMQHFMTSLLFYFILEYIGYQPTVH